jgi:hypothetical protein
MIAHRLSTIKTAKNLVYIEDNSTALHATKGTPEYDSIIDRLERLVYAHQKEDESDEEHEIQLSNKKKVEKARNSIAEETDKDDAGILYLESQPAKDEKKSENEIAHVDLKPASIRSIMEYYDPKYVAYIALFVAIINSFAYPLNGLIFTEILFILLQQGYIENFWYQINFWCGMYVILTAGVAFFSTL